MSSRPCLVATPSTQRLFASSSSRSTLSPSAWPVPRSAACPAHGRAGSAPWPWMLTVRPSRTSAAALGVQGRWFPRRRSRPCLRARVPCSPRCVRGRRADLVGHLLERRGYWPGWPRPRRKRVARSSRQADRSPAARPSSPPRPGARSRPARHRQAGNTRSGSGRPRTPSALQCSAPSRGIPLLPIIGAIATNIWFSMPERRFEQRIQICAPGRFQVR